jgi:hypothetical protein
LRSPFDTDSSTTRTGPSFFRGWFQPLLGRFDTCVVLACRPRSAWLVRPAEAPGSFALTYRCVRAGEARILRTDIAFDPLRRERRLSVAMPDGIAVTADWGTMLHAVLRLSESDAFSGGRPCEEGVVSGADVARLAAAGDENVCQMPEEPQLMPLPISRRPIGRVHE